MVKKSLLIEISHCLQLAPIGSLQATLFCFDPELAREGGGGIPRDNDVITSAVYNARMIWGRGLLVPGCTQEMSGADLISLFWR